MSFVAAANNVPFITVGDLNGNMSMTHRWTVSEQSSFTFSTSDPDSDPVVMYNSSLLPPGSSLTQESSSVWKFVWTPQNMDPVELV